MSKTSNQYEFEEIRVRLPKHLAKWLKMASNAMGMTQGELLVQLLEPYCTIWRASRDSYEDEVLMEKVRDVLSRAKSKLKNSPYRGCNLIRLIKQLDLPSLDGKDLGNIKVGGLSSKSVQIYIYALTHAGLIKIKGRKVMLTEEGRLIADSMVRLGRYGNISLI